MVHVDTDKGSASILINMTRLGNVTIKLTPSLLTHLHSCQPTQHQAMVQQLQAVAKMYADLLKDTNSTAQTQPGIEGQRSAAMQAHPALGVMQEQDDEQADSMALLSHENSRYASVQNIAASQAAMHAVPSLVAADTSSRRVRPHAMVPRPIPTVADICSCITNSNDAPKLGGYTCQQLRGYLQSTQYSGNVPDSYSHSVLAHLVVAHTQQLPGKYWFQLWSLAIAICNK